MLSPIRTSGNTFITSDNARFKYVGVSAFGLFKRWLMPDGPNALIAPILAEWRSLATAGGYTGPIVCRVFRYAQPSNAFGIDPWSYDFSELARFSTFLEERGFYVDWTCGDSQVVLPDQHGDRGQQQHLNLTCAALAGNRNVFIQTCNEPFKNGIDVGAVIPPVWGTYLRSSGYYTEGAWDHSLDLDFIDFHPDRSTDYTVEGEVPKWLGKLFESGVYLMPFSKPIVYGEPIGADEVTVVGRRSNNPAYFARMGQSISFVAGITFHSTAGLSSDGLGPFQQACAVGFFKGVQSGMGL